MDTFLDIILIPADTDECAAARGAAVVLLPVTGLPRCVLSVLWALKWFLKGPFSSAVCSLNLMAGVS